ncbi:DUF11 domain-containing protein [Alienimonas chondri]|uniref:DUF11 domain-containing protein n=1 Tax=Alienimonas chondri TaxID=2681879 RepID=A0ABX1V8Q9_9PLAN|nr:DUF11 domain-containing protein [Alienimonas chondri]NNJ23960.1 hypothetical protein [Alienimonas chondri]
MGAAILKAGGMATALLGGAFALLQANDAVEGSLAAAAVAQAAPDGADDFGEDFGENPGDVDLDTGWFDDAPATEPTAVEPSDDASWPEETPAFEAGAAFDEAPVRDATTEPRRIEPTPEWPAEEPAVSPGVEVDFDSWTDPPTAAPVRPAPAERESVSDDFDDPDFGESGAGMPMNPRTPVPAQPVPAQLEFDDRRPADAAVQLSVVKNAPAEAKPGESFVYTITVTNDGRTPAKSVSVEEPVPAGVTLEGTDPRADLDGRTLRWALGDLQPGGTREFSIKVVPDAAGTVGSVTVVRCDLSAAARTAVLAPRLTLSAAPNGSVRAGRPFDLNLTVTNAGTANAPDAAVRTLLPAGVTHASGEQDLVYDLGALRAGETRDVSLTVVAKAAGPVQFSCEVTAAGAAPAASTANVEVGRRQLTLTRSGPRTRFLGRTGTFENVVTNASNAAAPPARVVEAVPLGMTFASATNGGTFDPSSRQVSWEVPALDPGRSATLGVELKAEEAGQWESVVALQSDGRTEAELIAATQVRGYTAVAPRIGGLNGPLAVGERVAVLVTLQNTGTETTSALFADVHLPPSMRALMCASEDFEAVEIDDGVRLNPKRQVAPGETVTAEVLVEGAAAGGGAIELSVSADHLPEPAKRSEPVRVYADAE